MKVSHRFWPAALALTLAAGAFFAGASLEVHADIVVAEDSECRYLKGLAEASSPDTTAWRQPAFNDTAWLAGRGPFFYEDSSGYGGNTDLAGMRGTYSCIFVRRTFTIANPAAISDLTLSLQIDDGCIAWLNGTEIARVNMPEGDPLYNGLASGALGEPNVASSLVTNAPAILRPGANVLAIQAFNNSLADSSDFLLAAALSSSLDLTPPTFVEAVPPPTSIVRELRSVEVIFDENVTGVDAADLRLNGIPATSVQTYSPRDYGFQFTEPAPGLVTVSWSPNPGITDLAGNPFSGSSWTYTLDKTAPAGDVLISEFLADNAHGLRDNFGNRSDWIELRNRGTDPINLAGWSLTDDRSALTKWRFPSLNLNANAYLLVWASGKDTTNPAAPLHTNFKLDNDGEYLALVDPNTNIISEFSPTYPKQQPDISYGRDRTSPTLVGYFTTPTPGAANATSGPGFAPEPAFSIPGGVYTTPSISVTLSAPSGTIRYTLDGTVPTQTSTPYTSPINFTTSGVLHARVFQTGLLPSPIGLQTYTLLASGTESFSSNLPLLIINTLGRDVPMDSRIPAFVTAIEPYRGRASLLTTPDIQTRAQIEIRGQSSAGFPKLGYNLELDDPSGNDADAPLLGLPAESDWVLYNPYSDKPFLQNFLAYELHGKMGHYAPRCRFVEVFLDRSGNRLDFNADYVGIYILVEKIKLAGNRVDLQRLTPQHNAEPEISGGYMVKKDKDSPGDIGFSTTGGSGFSAQYLKIHEPKPREVTTAQLAWIQNYLKQFERALYSSTWLTGTGTNHYSNYIDVDSFVDNHWIVEFPKQIDGYRLSNYMHKDRGGKLCMDPIWDWNLSFGNADYLDGAYTNGWYYSLLDDNAHIWLRRLITGTTSPSTTSGDPEFTQKIADRWSVLRTNIFASTNLLARVDELAAYLNEAQARDFARWPRLGTYIWPNPPLYSTPTTYAGIIANLKAWIQGRYNWIDTQFLRPPTISRPDSGISPGFSITLATSVGSVYYTLDGTDPRAPGGTTLSAQARLYSGPITLQGNSRVVARARSGSRWSGPAAATFTVGTLPLVVSELMFHPAATPGAPTDDSSEFEFIELKNTGPQTLDLRNFSFVEGITFSFATSQVASLAPGARLVLARNAAALTARHGNLTNLAGSFDGALDNQGEHIRLRGPMQETVLEFTYDPAWFPAADGLGFSLVPADELQSSSAWSQPTGWRLGATWGGTPGQPDTFAPDLPSIRINEILANVGPTETTAIEIFNPTPAEVDIGGWFLSDDRLTPKFRIPFGTRIGPGAFLTFIELDYNPHPGIDPSFNLSPSGDDAYLFSADAAGRLTGYQHGFSFGPAARGVAFGPVQISTGEERLVALTSPTLGRANTAPRIGPILISEIMYHPPDVFTNNASWDNTEHEFIELRNLATSSTLLYDPNAPSNTWRLTGAVQFRFPTNQSVAAGERVLVVPFNPATQPAAAAAFRAQYGLGTGIRLFGPFTGKLANDSDTLTLTRPELATTGTTNLTVLDVAIDRVQYSDNPPWPVAADGFGFSLQRLSETTLSDDPATWTAAPPSPGQTVAAGSPPVITRHPSSQRADPGSTVTLTVESAGPGPLRYQWLRNGSPITNATAASLILTNVQPTHAGLYCAIVLNSTRAATSTSAFLRVGPAPIITAQPLAVAVRPGDTATFSVIAAGSTPLDYQWRRNGLPIPDARRSRLTLTAIDATAEGTYDVIVSDALGDTVSAPAPLDVLGDPTIVHPPLDTTVSPGDFCAFGVAVTNTALAPFTYEWLKDGQPVALHTHTHLTDFLTLANVQPADAGTYSVRIANPAIAFPGLSSPTARLTVIPLTDTDNDGLPDAYETSHSLDPHNSADANADPDYDGASNLDEYRSGTDPQDPNSVLTIDRLDAAAGILIRFRALTSRSYAVLWRDRTPGAPWQVLDAVPATTATGSTLRTLEISDPAGTTPAQRYYRLVTPGR